MIERFYLKNCLDFDEVELNFGAGLIVFSGPSGSGKSVLLESILSSFGGLTSLASFSESSVCWDIEDLDAGIESEEINVFKHIKKEKSRYFINNQSLSKKAVFQIASKHLRHLSLKDFSDFETSNLIDILDASIGGIKEIKTEYKKIYERYNKVSLELRQIEDEQRRIVELKEFAQYEINKIDEISPKIGEDEELLEIKKELSKKEKVLESISQANEIFNYEYFVSNTLDLLGQESAFFDDVMNELRAVMETAQERFSALDDVDVEEVLNRIEMLGELKRRYGTIEDALEYKQTKIQELQKYNNIEIQKDDLLQEYKMLQEKLYNLAQKLSDIRSNAIKDFEKQLNIYLKELYLRDAKVVMKEVEYFSQGKDALEIKILGADLMKLSTGEFNRLRLAVLALKSEYMMGDKGVLMLDEIDANLSGEESMSVAKVLKKLSKSFQIFVISHQPQLTSMGDQHFFVYKEGKASKVKELNFDEKIEEIARIISGESISDEAKGFAKELLEAKE